MRQPLSKPHYRSPLRMALGKTWFITKRRVQWYLPGKRYAATRSATLLPHQHASHRTPLLRKLKGVDMWLQHNKVESLKVAASCIDGLLLEPGETFSFWRLVGKPTAKRGFKTGMVLRNGTVAQGMGGGLCQMTNLIYWMALHTELSITERWRHGFDVFPDEGRSQPFASGATCSYNYIDLQISNKTANTYQLGVRVEGDYLQGEWRADVAPQYSYRIVERDHAIRTEWWGGYSRHNSLHRMMHDIETGGGPRGRIHHREPCLMMYAPLLENLELSAMNIVFDIGNVLLRWDPRFLFTQYFDDEAQMEWFLAHICNDAWNLEQDRGRSFAEAVKLAVAQHPDHAEAIAAYDTRWHETLPHAIEGTVAIFKELVGRDEPVYAITNWNGDKFREAKQRFPFLYEFRDIVVSGDEKLIKPDPAIYQLLLGRNGLEAADCLFIDDSLKNVKGAEAIGMKAHHFTSPEGLRKILVELGLL